VYVGVLGGIINQCVISHPKIANMGSVAVNIDVILSRNVSLRTNHSADNSAFGDILLQSNQLKLPVFYVVVSSGYFGNIVINPPGTAGLAKRGGF
jgi:hypothetical protein